MSKYGNRKTTIDGHTFDSKAEARRYQELKLLARARKIHKLVCQPRVILQEGFRDRNGKWWRPITYIADFGYIEHGQQVMEDTKGVKTAAFSIKLKLLLKQYPHIDFRVVDV